jgi:lipoprotein-releasing system ATP-binding protein
MNDPLSGPVTALVEVKDVYKSYEAGERRVEVLRGVNLMLGQGERLGIIGESGVGKSTLLYLLGTLEKPTTGTLLYGGESITELTDRELSRFRNHEIGFIFQFHYLLPDFTAMENVMMPALISGWHGQKARAAASELLQNVGLSHRMTHRPGELSGGEQQRVAVARSLILEPNLILADEPTGNLDPDTGREIEDVICELNESKGVGLIVTTHNHGLAARMSRQLELRQGQLLACHSETADS